MFLFKEGIPHKYGKGELEGMTEMDLSRGLRDSLAGMEQCKNGRDGSTIF